MRFKFKSSSKHLYQNVGMSQLCFPGNGTAAQQSKNCAVLKMVSLIGLPKFQHKCKVMSETKNKNFSYA